MDKILYGVAYYDEYMPTERLNRDMQMMKKAGINVIHIAESTWASEEISDGVFHFHHVERSIEAAARYGIRDVAQEAQFPVNIKSGINTLGRQVHYYFNYSGDCIAQKYLYEDAVELISGKEYSNGQTIQMQPWSVYILEEQI